MDPLGGITAFPVFAALPLTAFFVRAAQAMERVHQELQGIIAARVTVAGLLLTAFLCGVAYKGTRLRLPLCVVGALEGVTLHDVAASVAVSALQHVCSRLQPIFVSGSANKVFAE